MFGALCKVDVALQCCFLLCLYAAVGKYSLTVYHFTLRMGMIGCDKLPLRGSMIAAGYPVMYWTLHFSSVLSGC